jgi:hypothetical protein
VAENSKPFPLVSGDVGLAEDTCQQVTSDVAIMRIWHKKFPRTSHEVLMAATGIWTTVTSLFERPNQVTAFDRAKRGH